jgi:hypothetical protein
MAAGRLAKRWELQFMGVWGEEEFPQIQGSRRLFLRDLENGADSCLGDLKCNQWIF